MEKTKKVLCISSLDTSGISGTAADVRAISALSVHAMPVVVNYVIETQDAVVEVFPIPLETIEKGIKTCLSEEPDAVKLGLIGRADVTERVCALLPKHIPVIADPVFLASSGQMFADTRYIDAFISRIAQRATLVTPNIAEAEMLLGTKINTQDDAKIACLELHRRMGCSVLLKGGHLNATDYLAHERKIYEFHGEHIPLELRSMGCNLAALISGYIALGYRVVDAVRESKMRISEALRKPAFMGTKYIPDLVHVLHVNAQRWETYTGLQGKITEFLSTLRNEHIPEVGINIGYAIPGATTKEDVCAIDGRIVKTTVGPGVLPIVKFGAGDHIPRIILTVMRFDAQKRCAMNMRYNPEMVEKAKKLGYVVGTFTRDAEREKHRDGTMEWGTETVIRGLGCVPDMIFDLGDVGKEPMIRLIAENPEQLLAKLKKLVS
jgi:hydroxymethylpyrimidine/phosphomethylpyrimidine kinase